MSDDLAADLESVVDEGSFLDFDDSGDPTEAVVPDVTGMSPEDVAVQQAMMQKLVGKPQSEKPEAETRFARKILRSWTTKI